MHGINNYFHILRLLGVRDNIWLSSLKLSMIERLEREDSEERIEKEEVLVNLMRDNGASDFVDLWRILEYYKEKKVKEMGAKIKFIEEFRKGRLKMTVLRGQCFVGMDSNTWAPRLWPDMCALEDNIREKHNFSKEQLKVVYLISEMEWVYTVKEKR